MKGHLQAFVSYNVYFYKAIIFPFFLGPTLGHMSISITKPPYYVNSRIIYNLEFIPCKYNMFSF